MAKGKTKEIAPKDETEALLRRAQKGDETAMPALRKMIAELPEGMETIGRQFLDAERDLIKATYGEDLLARESVPAVLKKMRADLAGPSPTPLEKLLVERIVMCWLHVRHADMQYSHHFSKLNLEQGDYYQRRQDRAHRRYLQAIKTLAEVRRLQVPAVQVNIGDQQVNVVQ